MISLASPTATRTASPLGPRRILMHNLFHHLVAFGVPSEGQSLSLGFFQAIHAMFDQNCEGGGELSHKVHCTCLLIDFYSVWYTSWSTQKQGSVQGWAPRTVLSLHSACHSPLQMALSHKPGVTQ